MNLHEYKIFNAEYWQPPTTPEVSSQGSPLATPSSHGDQNKPPPNKKLKVSVAPPAKRVCPIRNSAIESVLAESEDDEDDGDDGDWGNDATPRNMRLVARKLRELQNYQLEGEEEAARAFLQNEEDLLQDEINFGLCRTPPPPRSPLQPRSPPRSPRPTSPPRSPLQPRSPPRSPLQPRSPPRSPRPTSPSRSPHQPNSPHSGLGSPPAPPLAPAMVHRIPPVREIFSWTSDFASFTGEEEVYLRNPGPHTNAQTPLDLFMEVWDIQFMSNIATETNRYAWQTIAFISERGEPFSATLDKWEDTTAEELYRFFAILNYMSICYRSRLDEYWTTGVLEMPGFRTIMSRNRFLLILRFLNFIDNDYLSPVGQTRYEFKIAKIAPLVEHCNQRFSAMYTPNRELSLDESLLLWKGRLSWVQCIRTKAARFGIKSFELCEAESGYLLRILLYAGKDSSMVEGSLHGFENTTAKVVLELMDGYLDVGHLLVMDNWYNQLVLTRFLKSRATDVIGTMSRRRQHVPDDIKTVNERQVARGDQIARHCGDISIVAWKDVKLVTLISTWHNADRVDGLRAGAPHTKPAVVCTYNKYMGGVDLKDQKLSQYFFERKRGRKWYIKVFRRLLNTTILNNFIISQKIAGFPSSTMRKYRYTLSEDILRTFLRAQVARPQILPSEVRLENTNTHFVVSSTRRRCAFCTTRRKQTRVTTMCSRCGVALCIGDCWISYHTLPRL